MKLLRNITCAFLIMAVAGLNAQTRYLDEVFSNVTIDQDITYGWNWSVIPTAEDTSGTEVTPGLRLYVDSLRFDAYMPASDAVTDRPVILLSHAGSFLPSSFTGLPLGSKRDSCLVEMCTRFAKSGYVAISFDYRLGWNPLGDQETRTKSIILAVYKAMQDAKALIRFLKENASSAGIDTNKIIIGGSNSGAYVALAAGSFNKGSELNHPKFLDTLGNSYVDQSLWGDFDGFGGAFNNSMNSPGHVSDHQLTLSLGGDVGDTSWIEAGEPPIIAFHGVADPGSPYNTDIVIVAATGSNVIEVSGPGDFMPIADALGNLDGYKGGQFCPAPASTDGIVYDGNYPFYGAGFEPWGWYNASTPLNPNASKTRAMAYIDTIMSYFLPRSYRLLIDPSYTDPCVIGIDETKINDVNVEVFPNPSHSDIIIRVNDASQVMKSIEVFDITGKLVRMESVNNAVTHTLKRSGLDKGAYFVNIQFEGGAQTYKRVMFE